MDDSCPQINPSYEMKVYRGVGLFFYNVINSLVEHRDGACDARNREGLSTENGKNECSHEGRDEHLGDAILSSSLYKI